MGWAGIKNGDLLARAETKFHVLLTADKNLRHQQDLRGLKLSIIVFPSNRLNVVKSLSERVKETLLGIKASEIVEL